MHRLHGANAAEHRRLQDERIADFGEYLDDVIGGSLPHSRIPGFREFD